MKEDSSMSNPVCPFWLSSLEHFQQQDRAEEIRSAAVCVASQSLRGIRGEIPQLTASMTATQIADPLMDPEVGEAAQHY